MAEGGSPELLPDLVHMVHFFSRSETLRWRNVTGKLSLIPPAGKRTLDYPTGLAAIRLSFSGRASHPLGHFPHLPFLSVATSIRIYFLV